MHGPLYPSTGVLRYARDAVGHRLTLDVDPELARYYRALIPRWIATNKPRYAPHITVVRPEKETPAHPEHLSRYDGQAVDFEYSGVVHHGKIFFWLNAFSRRLEAIRAELGLQLVNAKSAPPDGYVRTFHITIAEERDPPAA